MSKIHSSSTHGTFVTFCPIFDSSFKDNLIEKRIMLLNWPYGGLMDNDTNHNRGFLLSLGSPPMTVSKKQIQTVQVLYVEKSRSQSRWFSVVGIHIVIVLFSHFSYRGFLDFIDSKGISFFCQYQTICYFKGSHRPRISISVLPYLIQNNYLKKFIFSWLVQWFEGRKSFFHCLPESLSW